MQGSRHYKYAVEANEIGMWQITSLENDVAMSLHDTKAEAISKIRASGYSYVIVDEHIAQSDQDGKWDRIDFAAGKTNGHYATQQEAIDSGKLLGKTMIVFNQDGSTWMVIP